MEKCLFFSSSRWSHYKGINGIQLNKKKLEEKKFWVKLNTILQFEDICSIFNPILRIGQSNRWCRLLCRFLAVNPKWMIICINSSRAPDTWLTHLEGLPALLLLQQWPSVGTHCPALHWPPQKTLSLFTQWGYTDIGKQRLKTSRFFKTALALMIFNKTSHLIKIK